MSKVLIQLDFKSNQINKEDVYSYLEELIYNDDLAYEICLSNSNEINNFNSNLNQLELPLTWR